MVWCRFRMLLFSRFGYSCLLHDSTDSIHDWNRDRNYEWTCWGAPKNPTIMGSSAAIIIIKRTKQHHKHNKDQRHFDVTFSLKNCMYCNNQQICRWNFANRINLKPEWTHVDGYSKTRNSVEFYFFNVRCVLMKAWQSFWTSLVLFEIIWYALVSFFPYHNNNNNTKSPFEGCNRTKQKLFTNNKKYPTMSSGARMLISANKNKRNQKVALASKAQKKPKAKDSAPRTDGFRVIKMYYPSGGGCHLGKNLSNDSLIFGKISNAIGFNK